MRLLKTLLIVVVVLVGAYLMSATFPVTVPPVEIAAEPIAHIPILGEITNSFITTWLVIALVAILVLVGMRRKAWVPSGLQNLLEILVEALLGLCEDVAGHKRARQFFPIVTTIFIFVLFSNWLGLFPGVGTIGILEEHEHETVLVPLLRSPSTDLNTTVGLALIAMALVQIFGIAALGLGYFTKFINVQKWAAMLGSIVGLRPRPAKASGYFGMFFMGFIDFFMGVLELVSEIAKIISFSFRLFGNIFAGEILLLVIASLVPYLLPLPFLGLEVFVGFIQAFVFAVLSLVFMTIATTSHGGEHAEAAH